MFCRHIFGNISGGFRGISRDFAEIPEALFHLGVYTLGIRLRGSKKLFRIKGLQKKGLLGSESFLLPWVKELMGKKHKSRHNY